MCLLNLKLTDQKLFIITTESKMRVPFGTISLTDTAKKLINEALDKNKLTCGNLVLQLERKFAEFAGTKYAVAVSSGTDAITIALAALHDYGMLPGREVIVPALTFIATANAVIHAGFDPVFVDIEKETLNIDTKQIEPKLSRATAAIVPVHLMGKPANMRAVTNIAYSFQNKYRDTQLAVIEDAAEAHGGLYYGHKTGSIGIAGCFSLYAAHIVSAIEGGMITTNDEEFARICRSLRSHGRACDCEVCIVNTSPAKCPKRYDLGYDKRFVFERIGYSSKMNELEAAVGLGTMEIADQIIEKRRENFYRLTEGLRKFDELYTIYEGDGEKIGPHAFPIILRVEQVGTKFTRDELGSYLSNAGIDSRTLFQSIPTQSKAYSRYNFKEDFPNAEYCATNGLHTGVHQDMGEGECAYILEMIEKFLVERK
jgi:dTDP-4-amino-4,6-dideoxygalactose transaminase